MFMDEVKSQQWISARAALISGFIAVDQLLNGKVEHLCRFMFYLLSIDDGLRFYIVQHGSIQSLFR